MESDIVYLSLSLYYMNYPRFNHTLLFHSDDATKLRLIAELSHYSYNTIKYSNHATLYNFVKLIQLISDPEVRAEYFNDMRDDGGGGDPAICQMYVDQVFIASQGIYRHLKRLAADHNLYKGEYGLLRHIYLSPGPAKT